MIVLTKGFRVKVTRIIFAVFLLGVGFAGGQLYLNQVYQRQVELGYRRALSEFATHFQALETEMGLAGIAQSEKQRNQISSNLRRIVYAAQSNLGQLPLGEIHLEKIATLLSEVYVKSYAYTQGETGDEELKQLYGQLAYVNQELKTLLVHKEREFPWVSWHEYLSTTVAVPNFMQALSMINADLEELKAPRRRGELTGETIQREKAIEVAKEFSGRDNLNFQVTNEAKGELPAYTVEAKEGEMRIILEISQRGGMVLWMSVSGEVSESNLSLEEIVAKGNEFLEQRGFPPLYVTDVQVLQNRATLTFVPERNGILRYAEPLKVQVSVADGSIIGFWGTPFYLAQSRKEKEVKTSQDAVWRPQDKVAEGSTILAQRLALILNEEQEEVLTKRLGVENQGAYYLIYLNAETGEEERIVQVKSAQFF